LLFQGYQTETEDEENVDPEQLGADILHAEAAQSNSNSSAFSRGSIANLDVFFARVYNYYIEKGFTAMILGRITNLITLAFTISFSSFLLLYIRWHLIFTCSSSQECENFIRSDVLEELKRPSAGQALVIIYFSIFSIYWLWNLLSFLYSISEAKEMQKFYENQLNIREKDLTHIEWSTIVERIVEINRSIRLCIVKDLSALDITNRIMRKDNYFIAIINQDILDIFNPFQSLKQLLSRKFYYENINRVQQETLEEGAEEENVYTPLDKENKENNHNNSENNTSNQSADDRATVRLHRSPWPWLLFGSSLEWNLRFIILHSLFDDSFQIRSDFLGLSGIRTLRKRFRLFGAINLVLLPFIMFFMIIFFFLRHAEELHSKRSSIQQQREFSAFAQWKLREFNELNHFFHRRLAAAALSATNYLQQFPQINTNLVAQCISYISGAFVAILLIFTFADTSLLENRIYDRTLLSWLAIFSAILALSRAATSDLQQFLIFTPHIYMRQLVAHTHYYPLRWRGAIHTEKVRKQFARMFRTKGELFIIEILSTLATPFLLLFHFPLYSARIIEFVENCTVSVQGMGHICVYAMLDLESCGDSRYTHLPVQFKANNVKPSSSGAGNEQPENSKNYQFLAQKRNNTADFAAGNHAKDGKLEKSLLSFAMNHPHWQLDNGHSGEARGSSKFLAQMNKDRLQNSGILGLNRSNTGDSADMSPVLSRANSDNENDVKNSANSTSNNADNYLVQSFSDMMAMNHSLAHNSVANLAGSTNFSGITADLLASSIINSQVLASSTNNLLRSRSQFSTVNPNNLNLAASTRRLTSAAALPANKALNVHFPSQSTANLSRSMAFNPKLSSMERDRALAQEDELFANILANREDLFQLLENRVDEQLISEAQPHSPTNFSNSASVFPRHANIELRKYSS
jgi:hypothetical protein